MPEVINEETEDDFFGMDLDLDLDFSKPIVDEIEGQQLVTDGSGQYGWAGNPINYLLNDQFSTLDETNIWTKSTTGTGTVTIVGDVGGGAGTGLCRFYGDAIPDEKATIIADKKDPIIIENWAGGISIYFQQYCVNAKDTENEDTLIGLYADATSFVGLTKGTNTETWRLIAMSGTSETSADFTLTNEEWLTLRMAISKTSIRLYKSNVLIKDLGTDKIPKSAELYPRISFENDASANDYIDISYNYFQIKTNI